MWARRHVRVSRAAETAALALGALALGLGGPALGDAAAEAASNAARRSGIIPRPMSIVPQPGWFTFDSRTVIRVPADDPDARNAADTLADLLMRCRGSAPAIENLEADAMQSLHSSAQPASHVGASHVPLLQVGTSHVLPSHGGPANAQPAIIFRRRAGLDPEAYRLEVTAHGIFISATGGAGLFYGAVTLWQMLTPDGAPVAARRPFPAQAFHAPSPHTQSLRVQTLHAQTIRDAPAYPWRGLMLDSARHFQSVAFIRSMIDTMALHKLNVLHWHLTDDQGWRLEILKYPRLTSVGAWRRPATPGAAQSPSTPPYGGFYTQAEVRDLVAYAARRHVQIVPEIEMPGHAQSAIAAYPEVGVAQEAAAAPPAVSARWGVHTHLFNLEPATFAFLENVLDEVMELFPSKYIHVGGDEAVKNEWQESAAVQARAHALGIKDADELQAYFTQEIGRHIAAHGRRSVGWDEILRPGLMSDAVVMSWHGTAGAHAAAMAGHDTVLSPWPTLYFDNRQSSLPTEVPGRLSVVSLEDVYRFEPRDSTLDESARHHVLGVQADLWTEHMQTEDRVQWMAWPRAAAVAELGWSAPERRNFREFLRRLTPMFGRYTALGITYADSALAVAAQVSQSGDRVTVALSNQASWGAIRYTVDGRDPSVSSALYGSPLNVALGTEIRAATFVEALRVSRIWTRRLDARSLARRDSHDLDLCTDSIGLLLEPASGSTSRGAPLAVDVMNPCWIYRDVELDRTRSLTAAVAPLPFNYEIGADAEKIRVGDARTADGELEIHIDGCDTATVATVALSDAAAHDGVTELPPVSLPRRPGRHDICVRFARPRLDPLWALDWLEIRG
ncbi:MAG TPA: family 20 glycosylhydrolase [Steroidobacteraceae bacterium]|nr:family 20 glycosylhydrolase [Steroidobacteraceae bacterium]